jgi:hypothetical protein
MEDSRRFRIPIMKGGQCREEVWVSYNEWNTEFGGGQGFL